MGLALTEPEDVFEHDRTRLDFADNIDRFAEEVAFVVFARLITEREMRLARHATCKEIDMAGIRSRPNRTLAR